MSEVEKIRERYSRRVQDERYSLQGKYAHYNAGLIEERERIYGQVLRQTFPELNRLRFLEIGAGTGFNLEFFHRIGIEWSNMAANELLEERLNKLRIEHPLVHVLPGNALAIDETAGKFDVVFQSMVFTSVLDTEFKKQLADKMYSLLKPGGIILWYDFKFNNPRNKDVKGVGKREIKEMFNESDNIEFYPVTLAPPVGRRIGRMYSVVNVMFPFLRSHIIAVIRKEREGLN